MLVLLVGLPAAGKTTLYRERLAATHAHVSKDLWPNARKRDARQRRVVRELLEAGQPVAVDNTNPAPEDRAPLLAIARELGVEAHAYWFPPDLDGSLARNAAREGRARVPDVGMRSIRRRLAAPTRDEGFVRIFTARLTEAGLVVEELPADALPLVPGAPPA